MKGRWALLVGILIGVSVLSLGIGAVSLSLPEVWNGVLTGVGLGSAPETATAVIWELRMPRTLAALLVGGGIAAAGVGLRGIYRSPMAEPYLLGISPAAGLGVVIGSLFTPIGVPPVAGAILGAATAVLMALGIHRLTAAVGAGNRLILLGVALGLTFLAWTVTVIFVGDSPRLPTFTYFVFGSFAAVTWSHFLVALPLIAAGVAIIGVRGRALDLMSLGDASARSLGVEVQRTTTWVLVAAGIAAGASVALAGVIGFVGLIAPHIANRIVGPRHGRSLPVAIAVGGTLLLICDIASRLVANPVEVPVGIVVAAIGGPALVGLLLQSRQA